MKKISNTTFLRELIESEFNFVTTKTRRTGLNSVGSKINFNKHNQFHILDVFELNTSLKQLIRILFSFKYTKTKYKGKFLIYVWSLNTFILDFIELFNINSTIGWVIKPSIDFPVIDFNKDDNYQKLLFVIGNPWLKHPGRLIDTTLIDKQIFLVNSLNFKSENKDLGFYKIQNELDDYKKLIVILIIFDSILSFRKKYIKISRKVSHFPHITKIQKSEFIKKNNKQVLVEELKAPISTIKQNVGSVKTNPHKFKHKHSKNKK